MFVFVIVRNVDVDGIINVVVVAIVVVVNVDVYVVVVVIGMIWFIIRLRNSCSVVHAQTQVLMPRKSGIISTQKIVLIFVGKRVIKIIKCSVGKRKILAERSNRE